MEFLEITPVVILKIIMMMMIAMIIIEMKSKRRRALFYRKILANTCRRNDRISKTLFHNPDVIVNPGKGHQKMLKPFDKMFQRH